MAKPTNRLGRKEPNNHYRSRFPSRVSTNRFAQTTTGETEEKQLAHPGEAEEFYRTLASAKETVRIGMEASGHARWFERLVAELQVELWTGDAAAIRAKRVRKQKTDRQDAQLILSLLLENRFPKIWCRAGRTGDLRQLLWHRHRMVQAHASHESTGSGALNEGLHCKKKLWRECGRQQLNRSRWLRGRAMGGKDLLELLDCFNPAIAELTQAIEREVENCPRCAGGSKHTLEWAC